MAGKICLETVIFLWSSVFLACACYLLCQRIRLLYLDAHPEKRKRCPVYYVGRYIGNQKYEPILVCSKEKYHHERNTWFPIIIYLILWIGLLTFFFILVFDKGTTAWFIYAK